MSEAKDAILVVNAGSSSIKLAVFAERGAELSLALRGQVDGLYTTPRFDARDPTGRVVAEKSWGRTALGHDGAIEYLRDFLQHRLAEHRLVGVGHRVVHGGREFAPSARLAIDLYVYRIRRELGSLAAALGGLDTIVFTGGIGEHAPAIRERVCRDAAWLGVELAVAANADGGARISTSGSRVSAWVIPTNEELMIARHTQRVLGRG
jgi:acetate kinase